jgi:membrane fusion protein (multidrug efflux system)
VPNPDGALRPGAFARVEVALGEAQPDALLVPSVALVANGAQQTVYVYRDGTAEPRAVQTGARTSDRVQVLSGLRPGDAVVVSGVQNVRPGLDLRIDTSATAFRPEDVQLGGEDASVMEETAAPAAPDPAPTP